MPSSDSTATDHGSPALFRDLEVQCRFERDGYAVIALLSPEQIAHLRAFHDASGDFPSPRPFHVSMDHPDRDRVKFVSDELRRLVGEALRPHLGDHRTFVASFVVKEPGAAGMVPPHQDWTFVDEERFASATVWAPLQDVDIDNGALGVIPGSHRALGFIRASPSPQCPSVISRHLAVLYPYLQVIPLRAGEALVFDHRLVHGSPPNLSRGRRIAVGVGVARQEAALLHHYFLPSAEAPMLETYAVDADFFLTHGNGQLSELHARGERPVATALEQRPLLAPKLSVDGLLARLAAHQDFGIHPGMKERASAALQAMGWN